MEVKGGSFQMGSNDGDSDEKPVHTVTVGDFIISKYEITFAQYDTYARDANQSLPDDEGFGRGDRPVINVSWYDAVNFLNWLSEKDGSTPAYTINGNTVSWNENANGWRLPTPACGRQATGRQTGRRNGSMRLGVVLSRRVIPIPVVTL